MATTKSASKPTERQRAVLQLLGTSRLARRTDVQSTGKATFTVVTAGGKPAKDNDGKPIKLSKPAVEGCIARGWLHSTPAGVISRTDNGVLVSISDYQITDEGKQARRAK